MNKQRPIELSDKIWQQIKKAANKSSPKTSRPKWILNAIENQLKKDEKQYADIGPRS